MSFLDTMKKEYDDIKESSPLNEESNSKNMPKLDDKTSKELQNTIQKNAQLINELKVRRKLRYFYLLRLKYSGLN